MNKTKLAEILENHKKWLTDPLTGGKANLQRANLQGADLQEADLRGADLQRAYLQRANLQEAGLQGADLQEADLQEADLRGAYLQGADLREANLRGVNLREVNLASVKQDFFSRLELAKNEVKGLYEYLLQGKIDGTVYQGECACFVGTIAALRKENYKDLSINLRPDLNSLTERWFLAIKKDDTRQFNPVVDITAKWLEEFMNTNGITYEQNN